jgi:hypothetical protein
MMKVRNRYWLHLMALALGGIACLTFAVYWSPMWFGGLFAVLVAAGRGLMRLECGLCGDALLYREHHLFGRDIEAWWPTLPDECQTCDHPVAAECGSPDKRALQGSG